jgi:hypothetical protein
MGKEEPWKFERAAAMQRLDFHRDGEQPINDEHEKVLDSVGELIEEINAFDKEVVSGGPNRLLLDLAKIALARVYIDLASIRLPERNDTDNLRDTHTAP